jgi:carboxypeptidase Taq
MPKAGLIHRSDMMSSLASLVHARKTSAEFKRLLAKRVSLRTGKAKDPHLTATQKACLREWAKEYRQLHNLPQPWVEEFSKITTQASQVWAEAKRTNQFQLFAPHLEKVVQFSREKASFLGYKTHPYEALLHTFEPSIPLKTVHSLFRRLRASLDRLIPKALQNQPPLSKALQAHVSDSKQWAISQSLLSTLPMAPEQYRLDLSSHPCSISIHPLDQRITTRFLPNSFLSNIYSVLHEAGHAMYEMGLPHNLWGTPLCQAASISIHESQSRFWEICIGKSKPFWQVFYPQLQKILHPTLKKISLDTLFQEVHHVRPSFVRVEADDMTYPLHVMLRFELEQALIGQDLSVQDLPFVWNELMKKYLGITPRHDREGCLQDIHWAAGLFGYFPTYVLGTLGAFQLFASFQKEHPNWQAMILEEKDLSFIRHFLQQTIHRHGKMFTTPELILTATGSPLSEKPFLQHLKTLKF